MREEEVSEVCKDICLLRAFRETEAPGHSVSHPRWLSMCGILVGGQWRGGLNGKLTPRITKSKFFLFHPLIVRI